MALSNEVVLSVRGEATRVVDPDEGTVRGQLVAQDDERDAAARRLAELQRDLESALAALGGQKLVSATRRAALTWATYSTSTGPNWEFSKDRRVQRGWIASAQLRITARDLTLLPALQDALAAVRELEIHGTNWVVDHDNPAWTQTRADAVQAALQKGRDYALALGGAVSRVAEIADVGMLGASSEPRAFHADALGHQTRNLESAGGTPTIDPMPQALVAQIDARLIANVPALG